MSRPQQHDTKIHAEVEDLEDLGFGESQDYDPAKFRQSDSTEHLQIEDARFTHTAFPP